MAQHDYVIDNQTFPNTRIDLNNVLSAIVSTNAGATAPSTTYAYQLWYDTTADILKMRNADDDAWITLFTFNQTTDSVQVSGEELVDDTTPQLGGNLDTNGNDVNFGDNDKAIFGAGSDLQIYHDTLNSYIVDSGTGDLIIQGGNNVFIKDGSGNNMLRTTDGAQVRLYYGNGTRLDTTSTGVDVTGTVTADGLTVDGIAAADDFKAISNTPTVQLLSPNSSNGYQLLANVSDAVDGGISIQDVSESNAKRFNIAYNGDISFYDSTGVTQGLFWDASTQRLGLGTTSPSEQLSLYKSGASNAIQVQSHNSSAGSYNEASLKFALSSTASSTLNWDINAEQTALTVDYEGSEKFRITSGGNVGIGTTSPSTSFHVNSGTVNNTALFQSTDSVASLYLIDNNTTGGVSASHGMLTNGDELAIRAVDHISFDTGTTERMRIDSSGNLLVGGTITQPQNLTGTSSQFAYNPSLGVLSVSRSSGQPFILNRTTTDGVIAQFRRNGSNVGSVDVTTTGTTYNTTSDLRLKTDIQPIDHATDMLMAMNPVSHRWKADPEADAVVGFIAQEMQEIVPEAVSGNADSDEMMAMDYGRITPVLVAALQDAHKKIEQLEQRIADMENN